MNKIFKKKRDPYKKSLEEEFYKEMKKRGNRYYYRQLGKDAIGVLFAVVIAYAFVVLLVGLN